VTTPLAVVAMHAFGKISIGELLAATAARRPAARGTPAAAATQLRFVLETTNHPFGAGGHVGFRQGLLRSVGLGSQGTQSRTDGFRETYKDGLVLGVFARTCGFQTWLLF
jgi:hypothetical protein